ncbi:MAG: amidohydrolase [Rhodanobacteraceae bacterium]|nr:amidohydrolase [Rhodanobacteraceae bacterium]
MRGFTGLCLLLLTSATVVRAAEPEAAVDTLLIGRIYANAQMAEPVSALAYDAAGRVIAYGAAAGLRESLESRGNGVREIVVDGTVMPGLIDAHGHLMGLGFSLLQADLVGTRSKEAVIDRLKDKSAGLNEGDWLLGRGWDQNDWAGKAFPAAADLDAAFPDRPVWLNRVDGHAGWANSAALRAAGIDARTADPEGGRLLRDEQGQPSGVLVDAAMDLIETHIPKPDIALRRRALRLALATASKAGLTGVHDAGVSREDLALYRELADDQALPLRVYAMADGDSDALRQLCREGLYTHPSGRLSMRAVKLYADGALGSRGAALLADYSDEPGNRGLLIQSPEHLREIIDKAAACGVQPAVHAIGDRANREVLDAYAGLTAKQRKALRPRIEHAQVVAMDDIPRFAELGVIASMQPTHATSDMPWAGDRVGAERLRGAYAWRRYLDRATHMAFGSDFPVENVEPIPGLYAAITRQDAEGSPEGGWLPDQRLTLVEALDAFTRGAAYAGFAENEVGTLEPGMRADFIVLSMDPHQVRGRALLQLKVRSTWLDGRKVTE